MLFFRVNPVIFVEFERETGEITVEGFDANLSFDPPRCEE
jgi:hypothetical protein